MNLRKVWSTTYLTRHRLSLSARCQVGGAGSDCRSAAAVETARRTGESYTNDSLINPIGFLADMIGSKLIPHTHYSRESGEFNIRDVEARSLASISLVMD